jgi:hypothetical protein
MLLSENEKKILQPKSITRNTLDGTLEGSQLNGWFPFVNHVMNQCIIELPLFLKEIKKFVGEKTLIKNFFKYKKGVSHYHFGAKAHSEMIVYTFLLPCKNEKGKMSVFLAGP